MTVSASSCGSTSSPRAPTPPSKHRLVVRDLEVLERRQLIREVMCRFQTRFDLGRQGPEWERLQPLAADGLVCIEAKDGPAHLKVSREGRWLLRTIAAVFDPQQPMETRGARSVWSHGRHHHQGLLASYLLSPRGPCSLARMRKSVQNPSHHQCICKSAASLS